MSGRVILEAKKKRKAPNEFRENFRTPLSSLRVSVTKFTVVTVLPLRQSLFVAGERFFDVWNLPVKDSLGSGIFTWGSTFDTWP